MARVRKAADLTQVAQRVAPQTLKGRLERRHDMLLSTLTGYLKAAEDHPRIVTVNGQDVELDPAALVD